MAANTNRESVRLRLSRVLGGSTPTQDASLLAAPSTSPPPSPERTPGQTEPETSGNASPTIETTRTPRDTVPRIAAAFGLRDARIDPGARAVRSLAALAVVVMVIAAGVAWWNRPRPEPIAAVTPPAPSHTPSPSASSVVVAVTGKVRNPGLVTLPPGARVADAIEAAGGVLPGTDLGYLNLARKVTDGELIVVGATPPPGTTDQTGPAGEGNGKVNLNTATLQELDSLPGVGPVLAQRIIDYRDQHGGFRSVEELRKVDGIGPSRYEELKDLVTV